MTTTGEDVKIWCVRCGRHLSVQSAADHTAICRPRWTYWWPRHHPYLLAALALTVGMVLGRVFGL